MNLPHPRNRLCASVPEAARLLGVSVSSVYRHADLPLARVGGRVVVPYGALAERLRCSIGDVIAALTGEQGAPN